MALNKCYAILAAVGSLPGAVNHRADVEIVQKLLNEHAASVGYATLRVDGLANPPTIQAIQAFQRKVVGMKMPDGRVDPGGNTLKRLNEPPVFAGIGGGTQSFAGKPLQERVDAFIAAAKSTYNITIPKGSEFRKPEDAQKWHVAHMIYYNSYGSLKPAQNEPVGGHNLIKWEHLNDASLVWQYVDWKDYLRTAGGQVPVKQGNVWAPGSEPEKEKTRARAYDILKTAGIGTAEDRASEPHSAQVAPGYQGCGEPCKCGGNRSKHIAGMAVDLGKTEMKQLAEKMKAEGKNLDDYLKTFGLHRPVMPSEPWHVEPTTP